jgi:phosphate transport system permease protein
MSGLITGIVLGIARVAGETAPLLILVGYAAQNESDLFAQSQASLPTLIRSQFLNINQATGTGAYHLDKNGRRVAGAVQNFAPDRMWGTALTLIIIVMSLNLVARLIGRRTKIAS